MRPFYAVRQNPKSKIVLLGWYGSDNTGDEAVLQAVAEALRARGHDDLLVLSTSPRETAAQLGVASLSRGDLLGAARAMRGARALVLGGGGLIQDGTSVYNLPIYTTYVLLARLLGLKVIGWGLGVEPIWTLLGKLQARLICRFASHFSVRDHVSSGLLLKAGVPPEQVKISADPAFLISPGPDALTRKSDRPLVVFCIRHLSDNHPGINLHYLLPVGVRRRLGVGWRPPAERNRQFIEGLARAIRVAVVELGAEVELLPLWPGRDDEMLDQVETAARAIGVPTEALRRAHVEPAPARVAGYTGNADLLVSMRLHALIFGARQGVPMLALSYAHKVRGLMRALNSERWVVEVETRTPPPEELEMKLRQLWQMRHEASSRIRAAAMRALNRAERDADEIARLLT